MKIHFKAVKSYLFAQETHKKAIDKRSAQDGDTEKNRLAERYAEDQMNDAIFETTLLGIIT